MGEYIDVHCHLEGERYQDDLDKVIKRAKVNNILIIQSGINPETNRKSLEISRKYDIYCSFGLYPIDSIAERFKNLEDDDNRKIIPFNFKKELEWIEEHKEDSIAIGEIGLDYKVVDCSEEMKQAQEENFREAIRLAKRTDKPIIVHSRGAEERAIEIIKEEGHKKVVMHCFSAKKGLIKKASEEGFFFSIPAIINRLQHFETVVKIVPLDQLLTETDSPYLSPEQGERNEPSNVIGTIKKISEIKSLKEEEVQKKIMKNFQKLFQ